MAKKRRMPIFSHMAQHNKPRHGYFAFKNLFEFVCNCWNMLSCWQLCAQWLIYLSPRELAEQPWETLRTAINLLKRSRQKEDWRNFEKCIRQRRINLIHIKLTTDLTGWGQWSLKFVVDRTFQSVFLLLRSPQLCEGQSVVVAHTHNYWFERLSSKADHCCTLHELVVSGQIAKYLNIEIIWLEI